MNILNFLYKLIYKEVVFVCKKVKENKDVNVK